MKCSYLIDEETDLIRKTHVGTITVDDEIALLDSIINDPKFRKGMNALCDFTEATVDWSLSELDRMRKYVESITERTGKCRWAVVTSGGVTDLTARVFILFHEAFLDTIQVKLFNDKDDALAWVTAVGIEEQS